MKDQRDKLSRFREGILLFSFLFLLVSFTNRSPGSNLGDHDKSLKQNKELFSKIVAVAAPDNDFSLTRLKSPVTIVPFIYGVQKLHGTVHEQKILATDKHFIKRTALTKDLHRSRFYYQIVPKPDEEFPSFVQIHLV